MRGKGSGHAGQRPCAALVAISGLTSIPGITGKKGLLLVLIVSAPFATITF